MWTIYVKYVLSNLRKKEVILWNLAFPIALATLFAFSFSGIDDHYRIQQIPVGIINNSTYRTDDNFINAMKSMESNEIFLNKLYDDENNGKQALENNEITSLIEVTTIDYKPIFTLTVKENGIKQTIVKSFLDSYAARYSTISTIMIKTKGTMDINTLVNNQSNFTKEISLSKNKQSFKVSYFYALLAMTCMYGAFGGISAMVNASASLSNIGARNIISATKKSRLLIAYMLSSITTLFITVLLVLAYITLVLKVDFGDRLAYVIFTCFIGSVFGITFGSAICSIPKLNETTMTSIVISLSMLSCFLAGMMNRDIGYMTMNKMPLIAAINPATKISDAFYCLYCYDSLNRYWGNIFTLIIMTIIMFLIATLTGKKVRYDSI